MPRAHCLASEQVRYNWDTGNDPVLTIDSGGSVVAWTRDGWTGHFCVRAASAARR